MSYFAVPALRCDYNLCLRSAVPLGDGKTSWAFKSGDSDTALKAGDSIGICFDQVTFCI